MAKLAIKSDNRKQNLLLPPSLDELVPENHMVRVVDAVIDRLDISDILSTYRGGGNSAFNPKMMLKVLIFAYLSNVYSSRRIEELLKRDIYFMWLAGMKRPDFRTINYYRGKRLKDGFDAVFTQVVRLLHEEADSVFYCRILLLTLPCYAMIISDLVATRIYKIFMT